MNAAGDDRAEEVLRFWFGSGADYGRPRAQWWPR